MFSTSVVLHAVDPLLEHRWHQPHRVEQSAEAESDAGRGQQDEAGRRLSRNLLPPRFRREDVDPEEQPALDVLDDPHLEAEGQGQRDHDAVHGHLLEHPARPLDGMVLQPPLVAGLQTQFLGPLPYDAHVPLGRGGVDLQPHVLPGPVRHGLDRRMRRVVRDARYDDLLVALHGPPSPALGLVHAVVIFGGQLDQRSVALLLFVRFERPAAWPVLELSRRRRRRRSGVPIAPIRRRSSRRWLRQRFQPPHGRLEGRQRPHVERQPMVGNDARFHAQYVNLLPAHAAILQFFPGQVGTHPEVVDGSVGFDGIQDETGTVRSGLGIGIGVGAVQEEGR
mmetsp:Transcript_17812/g.50994  ORF Transcript_17812/g.50994 Transcript_17812/m.50994 type:complete len:336 (+) Transcript_17812:287-1294(+)